MVDLEKLRMWDDPGETLCVEAAAEIERLQTANEYAFGPSGELAKLRAEVERLALENWQLRGALGYPVPGDIPQGDFKCGLCEARAKLDENVETPFDADPEQYARPTEDGK